MKHVQLLGGFVITGALLGCVLWVRSWPPQWSMQEAIYAGSIFQSLGSRVTEAVLEEYKRRPGDIIREQLADESFAIPGFMDGVGVEIIIASDTARWLTLDAREIVLVVRVPDQRHIKAYVYDANTGGRLMGLNEEVPQIAAPTESIRFHK